MNFKKIEEKSFYVAEEILGKRPPSLKGIILSMIGLSVIAGFIVTLFQPANTLNLPFYVAAVTWIAHFIMGAFLMTLVVSLSVLVGLPIIHSLFLTVVLMPPLMAPFSLAMDYMLDPIEETKFLNLGPTMSYLLEVIAIAPVALGMTTICALVVFRAGELTRANRNQLLNKLVPEPHIREFINGIPERLGTDLIRAEAQDHYVKLVFINGEITLKNSFETIVDLLEKYRGAQCHRSHWVRYKHIKKVGTRGSAYYCELSNGERIPVSRRKYALLKDQR